MIYSFDSLRHNAVIRRNDQNYKIGYLCASCTHSRERFVSRRIYKRYSLTVYFYGVCAYVLCNTSSLSGNSVALSYIVEKGSFTVIDMSHNGNHGSSRNKAFNFFDGVCLTFEQHFLRRLFRLIFKFDTESCRKQCRRIVINRFVYGFHYALFKELFRNIYGRNS